MPLYAHFDGDQAGLAYGLDQTTPTAWVVTARKRPKSVYSYPVNRAIKEKLDANNRVICSYSQLKQFFVFS